MTMIPALFFSILTNQIITRRNLYLASILLVIGGSFSSWWCRGDFVNVCTPGVKINFSLYSLLVYPERLFIALIIAVIAGLVFQSLTSAKVRKIFVISGAVLGVGYLVIAKMLMIEDNGGSLVILLSIIAAWLMVRPAKIISHPNRIIIIIGLILALVSGYLIGQALSRQAVEKHLIGGFTLASGLPMILISSLLILITGVLGETHKLRS